MWFCLTQTSITLNLLTYAGKKQIKQKSRAWDCDMTTSAQFTTQSTESKILAVTRFMVFKKHESSTMGFYLM